MRMLVYGVGVLGGNFAVNLKLCASDHAISAADEMGALNRDLKTLFEETGAKYPTRQALEADAAKYLV